MANELSGKRIAFLTANEGVEQVELTEPWKAVERRGRTARAALAPEAGNGPGLQPPRQGRHVPRRRARSATPARRTTTASSCPVAWPTPTSCASSPRRWRFVEAFFDAGTPVAAICHAPWTLVEADVVNGRTLTSWPSLQTDIRNAGGTWVDEEVVVDGNLVTSRKPDDLPAFCARMVAMFAEGRKDRSAA